MLDMVIPIIITITTVIKETVLFRLVCFDRAPVNRGH
jgi:hypothetical protein